MKFLITVPENSIARNLLRSGILLRTLTGAGHSVTLACPPEKLEAYSNEFGRERVTVRPYTPAHPNMFEKMLMFLSRTVFYSESNIFFQERAAWRGQGKVPLPIKKLLITLLGRSRSFKRLVRFLELRILPSASTASFFGLDTPDVLFATIIFNTECDVPLLREAQRRGIRTYGMVRSWDNLSGHGFVRVLPDTLLVQNNFLAECAFELQAIERKYIRVIGEAYYDNYFNNSLHEERNSYCARMGIDPKKRIVLYAAIGDPLFPNEGELADIFNLLVESSKIPSDCHFIFRAHPAFPSPLERMKNLAHVTPDRGATYEGNSHQLWDMDQKHVAHFINSLRHADVIITAGSTVMIDAVAFGKPVVAVAFDALSEAKPFASVKDYFLRTVHIKALVSTRGVRVASNVDELAQQIALYLKDPNADSVEREALKKHFASPLDGHSTERIAAALLENSQ